MRDIKRAILAICASILTITPSEAFAGQTSGVGKITVVWMDAQGSMVRIEFNQPIVNPDHCGDASFYMLEITNANQDRYLSMLMSAFYANKSVNFWISGCTTSSPWGATHPVVTDIYVHP